MQLPRGRAGRRRNQPCLVVQTAHPDLHFLIVDPIDTRLNVLDCGTIEPIVDESISDTIARIVERCKVQPRQAILLLSRPEIDVTSIELPPADEDEVAELVTHTVAPAGDDETNVIDYLIGTHRPDNTRTAMTFQCDKATLDDYRTAFRRHGMELQGVTYRGYGSVHLLRRISLRPAPVAVIVTRTAHDIEMSIEEKGQPILFRTLSASGPQLDDTLVERIGQEIERTLASVGHAEDDATRIYILGDVAAHKSLAEGLTERLTYSVSMINPLDHIRGPEGAIPSVSDFANLIGVARAWRDDALELNLLDPKRPPVPPSPWRRARLWGSLTALVVLTLGFIAWDDRQTQLDVIADLQRIRKPLESDYKAAQQQLKIVQRVRDWQQDEVVWLDELQRLSQRLPHRDRAVVRRFTGSTRASRLGAIDLSLQVASPEVLAELESQLRDVNYSVASQRISGSGASDLAWQFETHITFRPPAMKDKRATKSTDEQATQTPASANTSSEGPEEAQVSGAPTNAAPPNAAPTSAATTISRPTPEAVPDTSRIESSAIDTFESPVSQITE